MLPLTTPVAALWPPPGVLANLQARAYAVYPSQLSWHGIQLLFSGRYQHSFVSMVVVCLAWPFLTFVTLLIFQASMRRAKIRYIHIVRCVAYGCSAAVWIGLPITTFSPVHGVSRTSDFTLRIAVFAAVLAVVNLYSLGCAFRRYLRFDHPWATVAASQIIVLMIFYAVAVNLDEIIR